jgi:hypothetical protein
MATPGNTRKGQSVTAQAFSKAQQAAKGKADNKAHNKDATDQVAVLCATLNIEASEAQAIIDRAVAKAETDAERAARVAAKKAAMSAEAQARKSADKGLKVAYMSETRGLSAMLKFIGRTDEGKVFLTVNAIKVVDADTLAKGNAPTAKIAEFLTDTENKRAEKWELETGRKLYTMHTVEALLKRWQKSANEAAKAAKAAK